MKVLFLTHYSSLYGANLSMLYLAEDLMKRYGIDVCIICPKKGELCGQAVKMGIRIYTYRYIPWRVEKNWILKGVLRPVINPFLFFFIEKKVSELSPDIIHANSSVVDLGVKLSYALKIPCVWHIREFGKNDYSLKYLVSKRRIASEYQKANAIIAVSNAIRRYYLEGLGNLDITVIHNGIKALSTDRIAHKTVNFCCVGRLCPSKGQMMVLKAIQELIRMEKSNFHFYFWGDGDKSYESKLKKYMVQHTIEEYVTFGGYIDDVREKLDEMDVGVVSSINEAFGRVTVEYMLAGMSVLATDTGGTREILGEEGRYFNVEDYKGLARLMGECIDNPSAIKKDGERNKALAQEEFLQEKCTDQVYNIYKTVERKS